MLNMLKNKAFYSNFSLIFAVFLVMLLINGISVRKAQAINWPVNNTCFIENINIVKAICGLVLTETERTVNNHQSNDRSQTVKDQWEDLINACIEVESEGNSQAVGDYGQAIGILQIWKITIDDVNRILGYQAYSYDDRYNPEKSKEIFKIYVDFYGEVYQRQTGLAPTDEIYARIWNGGPKGWRKISTGHYWYKVDRQLKSQAEELDKLAKN